MIYLFAGDDTKKKRIVYDDFVISKSKDLEVFFINKNNFDYTQTESLYSSAGLFFSKCAVFFENVFENEEIQDFLLTKLNFMAESPNDFIFLEGHLNKPILDIFKKMRAEMTILELTKEKKEKYNNFLLANDFGARDKLNIWIHFREAMDIGVGMEELIGVLFWKAKDMILKKDFKRFSEIELKNFASKISYLLPEARKKDLDDEAVFEKFLLEVL